MLKFLILKFDYDCQVSGDMQYEDPCQLEKYKTTYHVTHCDRYYACYDGKPLEFDCPNGLVYVGKGQKGPFEGVCDYDFNVDCAGREKRSKSLREMSRWGDNTATRHFS